MPQLSDGEQLKHQLIVSEQLRPVSSWHVTIPSNHVVWQEPVMPILEED